MNDLPLQARSGAPENEETKDSKDDANPAECGGRAFRLYKMRFAGCFALCVFNIVCALNWVLFSAIAIDTANHFDISLTRVNWLANIVCAMYVVVAPLVPWLVQKASMRGATYLSAILLLIGSWMRYGATASTFQNNPNGAYALLFVGSMLVGISQCILQVIPPAFSETWFGLKSRTTVTMLCAVANPFGGAIGQLLAPAIVSKPSDLPSLLRIVAIISSAVAPIAFLVLKKPPTPPTRTAEGRGPMEADLWNGALALFGMRKGEMTSRERLDLLIISLIFAVLIGFFDAFLTLTNQIFEPVGYSSDMAGYIGAAVIVSGLLAAIASAPLFDRYFQYRLAFSSKILVPVIGISFFVLIWVVKPNNLGAIFFIAVLLGVSAFVMLPVALELAAEVAYKAVDPCVTSAILYLLGNGFSVITVVGMNALKAGDDASPPNNMKKALIFEGVWVLVVSFCVFALRGEQGRKRSDAEAAA